MTDENVSAEVSRFSFEAGEELLNELNNFEGVSPELMVEISKELSSIRQNPENTLLYGTDGLQTVTVFLVPHSIINSEGPVLVPSSRRHCIVSMVSRDFVTDQALICEHIEDPDVAQKYWDDFLDGIYTQTIKLGADEDRQVLNIPDFPQV